MMIRNHAVFTLATGNPAYLKMAFALARSFKLWHRNSDIAFFLATDRDRSALPRDLRELNLISLRPSQFGNGFEPKLNLDHIAPAPHSLFIDADCLCVGSLDVAFEAFAGRAVSVIGREISFGEWFGDVAAICKNFGVPAMPRFNGGVYYLERGAPCTRVYESARSLLLQYDEIGFKRLRGCPNDEVIISLAMALHGQKPVPERGEIMNSLLAAPGGLEIDVFGGRAVLRNPRQHPRHNSWYEMEEMKPRLVHFLGSGADTYPYRQEMIRLDLVERSSWPVWLATIWSKLIFSFPWLVCTAIKNCLRPLYRATFGPRSIQARARF
jgi:hypothetical protein